MKILLIADIHGNIHALKAIFSKAGAVEKVICLGDLVGYFPYVNEVVETIASIDNLICVKGNHDHVLINENLSTGSYSADMALSMQRSIINETNRQFLSNLPETLEVTLEDLQFFLFHGSPKDPLNGRDNFWDNEVLRRYIYLFGHSHKALFREDNINGWMVINPSSCGLPRDGDPRASYAIFDTEKKQVFFNRVAYSIKPLVQKCRDMGLPDRFWKSLEAGKWVSESGNEKSFMKKGRDNEYIRE